MKRVTKPSGTVDEARLLRMRARLAALSAVAVAAAGAEGCERQPPAVNTPAPQPPINYPVAPPTVNNPPLPPPDAAPPAPPAPDAAANVQATGPDAAVPNSGLLNPPMPTINRPPRRVPPGNG